MFRWHRVLVCVCLCLCLCLIISICCTTRSWAENARQLTFPPPGYGDGWPSFSPLGDKVAFGRYPIGQKLLTDLYVADIATSTERILAASGLPPDWNPNGGPEWSPDGQHVAFYTQSGQQSSVWIADVAGAAVLKILAVTETGTTGDSYALASDGTIYLFDLNGNGPISSQVVGNLFGGLPLSPILSAARGDVGGIMVTLENGDVWQWIGNSAQGAMVGNIFIAAGVTAVAPRISPATNRLALPRPNPFNPNTEIPYTLASAGHVTIGIFDVSGKLVRMLEDLRHPAGGSMSRGGTGRQT